jgi:hypothetical protein
MTLTDDQLFDFDKDRIEWSTEAADTALAEYPDLYRNHLAIALWLDRWQQQLDSGLGDFNEFRSALREVAAHLRQADCVPTGPIYRTVIDTV